MKWKYQRYIKDYLRCVQSVDDNLGRVLDYLDKSGLAKTPSSFTAAIRVGTSAIMAGTINAGCTRKAS